MQNYMWSRILMEKADDGGSGSGDSDGDIDAAKIDWSNFDITAIPEDVIKKTAAFVKVRDEAAIRRKENTQLKKQVEASVKNVETDPDADVQDDPKPEEKPNEVLEAIKGVQTQLDKIRTDNIESWRKEAATLYNIKNAKVLATVEGETREAILANAKTLADELGLPPPTQSSNLNPNIIVGNPAQTRDKGFLEAVKAEMRGQRGNKVNPFSPEVQRAQGGGVLYMDD